MKRSNLGHRVTISILCMLGALVPGSLPADSSLRERLEVEALAALVAENPTAEQVEAVQKFRFASANSLRQVAEIIVRQSLTTPSADPNQNTRLRNVYWNWVESSFATPQLAQQAVAPLTLLSRQAGNPLQRLAIFALGQLPSVTPDSVKPVGPTWPEIVQALLAADARHSELKSLALDSHTFAKKLMLRASVGAVGSFFAPGTSAGVQAAGFNILATYPAEVAQLVVGNLLHQQKIFDFRDVPATDTSGIGDVKWNYRAQLSVGRCGDRVDQLTGSSLANHDFKGGCRYGDDGADSEATLKINTLETDHVSGVTSVDASIASSAKGGWRHGGIAVQSEDETSSIRYEADGELTIPACPWASNCSPSVRISYSASHPSGAGAEVILESGALSGPVTLTPDQPLVLDRATAPARIRIQLHRDYTHIGSFGEEPPRTQLVHVQITENRAAPERTLGGFWYTLMNYFADLSEIYQHPGIAPDLAQMLTGTRISGTEEFGQRFLSEYARLLLLRTVQGERNGSISGQDRHNLDQVAPILSRQIAQKLRESVRSRLQDRQAMLRALPVRQVANEIERLMDSAASTEPELWDQLADALAPLLGAQGAAGSEATADILREADQARRAMRTNLLLAAAHLSEIRDALLRMQDAWESEIAGLSAEAAQMRESSP